MQEIQRNHFSPEDDAFRAYLYTVTEKAVRSWVRKWHLSWEEDAVRDFASDVYADDVLPRCKQLCGRPEHSIRAFISNPVQWALSKRIKRQVKQPQLMKDAADLERLPNACYEPDHAAGIEREEAMTWVEQALQTLSPYERAVWILRQRLGWKFKRIAKRLRTRDLQRRKAKALYVVHLRANRKIMAYLKEKVIRA